MIKSKFLKSIDKIIVLENYFSCRDNSKIERKLKETKKRNLNK